jgi:hypothetical protein
MLNSSCPIHSGVVTIMAASMTLQPHGQVIDPTATPTAASPTTAESAVPTFRVEALKESNAGRPHDSAPNNTETPWLISSATGP